MYQNSNGINTIIDATIIFSKKLVLNPETDFSKQHHKCLLSKILDNNPTTQTEFSLKLFY